MLQDVTFHNSLHFSFFQSNILQSILSGQKTESTEKMVIKNGSDASHLILQNRCPLFSVCGTDQSSFFH